MALLPKDAVKIRKQQLSLAELAQQARLALGSRDLDELLRQLVQETRLLTPVETQTTTGPDDAGRDIGTIELKYQLTHDLLLPSLREWLSRQRSATRKGRAQLCIEQRANAWRYHEEDRQLPSLLETLQITGWTASKDWTSEQRSMMRCAIRRHGIRASAVGLLVVIAGLAALLLRTEARVSAVLHADLANVPHLVDDLGMYRPVAVRRLRREFAESEGSRPENDPTWVDVSSEKTAAALALVASTHDRQPFAYLCDQLFRVAPKSLPSLLWAIQQHPNETQRSEIAVQWRDQLQTAQAERFLRLASALLAADPVAPSYLGHDQIAAVVEATVTANVPDLRYWANNLSPIRQELLVALIDRAVEPEVPATQQLIAIELALELAAGATDLANISLDSFLELDFGASPQTFTRLVELVRRKPQTVDIPAGLADSKKRGNAWILAARIESRVRSDATTDPANASGDTYFVNRCKILGIPPQEVATAYFRETSPAPIRLDTWVRPICKGRFPARPSHAPDKLSGRTVPR